VSVLVELNCLFKNKTINGITIIEIATFKVKIIIDVFWIVDFISLKNIQNESAKKVTIKSWKNIFIEKLIIKNIIIHRIISFLHSEYVIFLFKKITYLMKLNIHT